MAKPIDSENVIAWLNAQIEKVQGGWLHDYGFPTNVIAALTETKRFVKNLPTIDAEPVQRGRWIPITNDEFGFASKFKCTYCRDIIRLRLPMTKCNYKYCPNCGSMNATDTNVGGKGGADNG